MKKTMNTEKLRVFYLDRVPSNKTLFVYVSNLDEAMLVIDVLTKRDLEDERITDNIINLEVFRDDEWEDWTDDNGDDFDVMMDKYKSRVQIEK